MTLETRNVVIICVTVAAVFAMMFLTIHSYNTKHERTRQVCIAHANRYDLDRC